MKYTNDQKVKIKDSNDNFVMGMILQPAEFGNLEDTYWVKYEDVGHQEVSIFTESTLDRWNDSGTVSKCVCGATAVGSVFHSSWCDHSTSLSA